VPTGTTPATEISTDVPTAQPSETPGEIATDTPAPTVTVTEIPAETPSPTEIATGDLRLSLITEDGGILPDTTRICVDTQCQSPNGDALANGARTGLAFIAAAPTEIVFAGLAVGEHVVTITNAAPYADQTFTVTVDAGTITDTTHQIALAEDAATVGPTATAPAAATPIATQPDVPAPTLTPTEPVVSVPDGDGTAGGGAASAGSSGGRAAVVTSLPKTGIGAESTSWSLALLVGAGLFVLAAGMVGSRRRSS